MLIIVFAVAVAKQNVFLVLFLLFIEVCAGVWYAVSYIPFGRKALLAILRRIGICMPCFFVYDSVKEARQGKGSAAGSSAGGESGGSTLPGFNFTSNANANTTGTATI
jgi:hypothetical protein